MIRVVNPNEPTTWHSRRGATDRRVEAARAAIENLRPAELAAELEAAGAGDVLLVDVRSPEERSSGCIAGSINVPRGALESSLDVLRGRAQRIVVYCESGARSALAASALYQLGFEDVAHLDGGLEAWHATGHVLAWVEPEPAPPGHPSTGR